MDSLKDALDRISALEKRMARLETLVEKPGGATSEPRAAEPPAQSVPEAAELAFPELDPDALYTPTERLRPMSRSALAVKCALEQHPDVLEKICLLWGHPECLLLLERIFVDERGDHRAFERDTIEEIMLLTDVCRDLTALSGPRTR